MWELHSDDSRTNSLQIRPSGNSYYEFSQSGVFRVGLGNIADAKIVIDSASGGDPQLTFDTGAADRSCLIVFKDEGTSIGAISYEHNGDYLKFVTGSSTTERFRVHENYIYGNSTQIGAWQDDSHHMMLRADSDVQYFQISDGAEMKFMHIGTFPNSGANTIMTISTGREMSGNFNDTSDRNLKTNIIDLADNQGLDIINKLVKKIKGSELEKNYTLPYEAKFLLI